MSAIPGIESFDGKVVHPDQWRREDGYRGRRIAVIGGGPVAVQLIPEIGDIAGYLAVFRPRIAPVPAGAATANALAAVPTVRHVLRATATAGLDAVITGTGFVGDRLPLAGKTARWARYLKAFTLDHVEHVARPVERVTASGVVTTDGTLREVDVIVCETVPEPTAVVAEPEVTTAAEVAEPEPEVTTATEVAEPEPEVTTVTEVAEPEPEVTTAAEPVATEPEVTPPAPAAKKTAAKKAPAKKAAAKKAPAKKAPAKKAATGSHVPEHPSQTPAHASQTPTPANKTPTPVKKVPTTQAAAKKTAAKKAAPAKKTAAKKAAPRRTNSGDVG